MKGIVLAGGSGSRLHPVTHVVSKQLLPLYDKPMVYYPISVLMLAGIRDILIISTAQDIGRFEELLGDGSKLGLNFTYKEQPHPNGLAEAFILGEEFIGDDSVCLVLGDNVFYGHNLSKLLIESKEKIEKNGGGLVFGKIVSDPERYGIVEFDKNFMALNIEEKPAKPKSNYAVVGLYFYDNTVVNVAKNLHPSSRGELEITDVNKHYLKNKRLNVEIMGRGFAWLDTGTHDSLLEGANFIATIQHRQALKIACLEEIAYQNKYISREQLIALASKMGKNDYGTYLLKIADE